MSPQWMPREMRMSMTWGRSTTLPWTSRVKYAFSRVLKPK